MVGDPGADNTAPRVSRFLCHVLAPFVCQARAVSRLHRNRLRAWPGRVEDHGAVRADLATASTTALVD
jgi:hypothetical protein